MQRKLASQQVVVRACTDQFRVKPRQLRVFTFSGTVDPSCTLRHMWLQPYTVINHEASQLGDWWFS